MIYTQSCAALRGWDPFTLCPLYSEELILVSVCKVAERGQIALMLFMLSLDVQQFTAIVFLVAPMHTRHLNNTKPSCTVT
jgi:hypothetical protein